MTIASKVLLLAEDDEDDFLLLQELVKAHLPGVRLARVRDGEELLDYLLRRGPFAQEGRAPWPSVILLDLNMPKVDGREALCRIKAHPVLRRIPVVILTTSGAEDDIVRTYESGASAYITKPAGVAALKGMIEAVRAHWLELVSLPPAPAR